MGGAGRTCLRRIRKSASFQKLKKGKKVFTPALIIQGLPQAEAGEGVGVGVIVSKKVGSAVCRNKVKRRLRALARETFPQQAKQGWDYVLIAHPSLRNRKYDRVKDEILFALKKLKQG